MELKICRICCENEAVFYIFKNADGPKICDKLMYCCVNVNVAEGDGLPTHICSSCESELDGCYQFILKCEAADQKFRTKINTKIYETICSNDNYNETQMVKNDFKVEILTNNPPLGEYGDNEEPFDNCSSPIKESEVLLIKNESCNNSSHTKKQNMRRKKPIVKRDFTCTDCGLVCHSYSSFISHSRRHSNVKPCACPKCDKKYKDQSTLNRHIERNHLKISRERKFMCDACGNNFFSKNDCKIHMRTHTGETPYSCSMCPSKFTQQSGLLRHLRRHTGEKPFQCSNCSKQFSSKDELKSHLLVHTHDKKFTCPICDGKFKYKNNLKKHIKLHTEKRSFVCSYCGKTFSAKGNLKTHIKSQHSEKSGQCPICMKSVSDLELHIRKHTGERKLKCELCSSTFLEQNRLTHHINIRHKNPDKYKCSYADCCETFPSQPMLNFHEAKLHGTEIPYPCDKCSRGFYRKNDLARHKISTHKERLNEA